jgi:hypothetical protein
MRTDNRHIIVLALMALLLQSGLPLLHSSCIGHCENHHESSSIAFSEPEEHGHHADNCTLCQTFFRIGIESEQIQLDIVETCKLSSFLTIDNQSQILKSYLNQANPRAPPSNLS